MPSFYTLTLVSALTLSISLSPVLAKDSARLSPRALADDSQSRRPRWWFFGGIDLGYSVQSTSVSGEESKTGISYGLKAITSYYFSPDWVFDGALGVFGKKVSGVRPTGFEGTLEILSAMLELSPRYRVTPRIEVGPTLYALGLTDVSHRPTFAPIIADEPSKSFVFGWGLQGLYRFGQGDLPMRVGLRLATDFDVPNRNIYEIQATFHIGFPISQRSGPKREEALPITAPSAPAPIAENFFELPLLKLHFEIGLAEMKSDSKKLVERLGTFFAKNQGRFEKILIEGHTDADGGEEYNQKLSEARAKRVAWTLERAGVPKYMVEAKGYGATRPFIENSLPNEPKNRRVLIKIFAPGDKKALLEELKEVARSSK